MKKNILCFCLFILVIGILTNCDKVSDGVKKDATKIINAFEKNDIKEINQLIFGYNINSLQKETKDSANLKSVDLDNGVLKLFFSLVSIEVKSIDKDTIIYKITAPDMSGFFKKNQHKLKKLGEIELKNYLEKYAKKAKNINKEIKIGYLLNDGVCEINYQTKEFIDAITGGLLVSYTEFYNQIIDEYIRGLEE